MNPEKLTYLKDKKPSSGSAFFANTNSDIYIICGASGEKVSLMQAKPKKGIVSNVRERGNFKLSNPKSFNFFFFEKF